jgi:hypothetical protein
VQRFPGAAFINAIQSREAAIRHATAALTGFTAPRGKYLNLVDGWPTPYPVEAKTRDENLRRWSEPMRSASGDWRHVYSNGDFRR